jgi:predicted GTPase
MILWCLLIPIVTSYFVIAKNASFIEVNAPNYNRQAALDISLPLFAVLGATGVGKSSFIATLGGRDVKTNEPPAIGHRLQSREFSQTIRA